MAHEAHIHLDGALRLDVNEDALTLFGGNANYLAFPSLGSVLRVYKSSKSLIDVAPKATGGGVPHRLDLTVLIGGHPVAVVTFQGGQRSIRLTPVRAFGKSVSVPAI